MIKTRRTSASPPTLRPLPLFTLFLLHRLSTSLSPLFPVVPVLIRDFVETPPRTSSPRPFAGWYFSSRRDIGSFFIRNLNNTFYARTKTGPKLRSKCIYIYLPFREIFLCVAFASRWIFGIFFFFLFFNSLSTFDGSSISCREYSNLG